MKSTVVAKHSPATRRGLIEAGYADKNPRERLRAFPGYTPGPH